MGEGRYQAAVAKGRRHLKFVIELCREQLRHGAYFLFEHPAFASSWMDKEMIDLIKEHGRGQYVQVWHGIDLRRRDAGARSKTD